MAYDRSAVPPLAGPDLLLPGPKKLPSEDSDVSTSCSMCPSKGGPFIFDGDSVGRSSATGGSLEAALEEERKLRNEAVMREAVLQKQVQALLAQLDVERQVVQTTAEEGSKLLKKNQWLHYEVSRLEEEARHLQRLDDADKASSNGSGCSEEYGVYGGRGFLKHSQDASADADERLEGLLEHTTDLESENEYLREQLDLLRILHKDQEERECKLRSGGADNPETCESSASSHRRRMTDMRNMGSTRSGILISRSPSPLARDCRRSSAVISKRSSVRSWPGGTDRAASASGGARGNQPRRSEGASPARVFGQVAVTTGEATPPASAADRSVRDRELIYELEAQLRDAKVAYAERQRQADAKIVEQSVKIWQLEEDFAILMSQAETAQQALQHIFGPEGFPKPALHTVDERPQRSSVAAWAPDSSQHGGQPLGGRAVHGSLIGCSVRPRSSLPAMMCTTLPLNMELAQHQAEPQSKEPSEVASDLDSTASASSRVSTPRERTCVSEGGEEEIPDVSLEDFLDPDTPQPKARKIKKALTAALTLLNMQHRQSGPSSASASTAAPSTLSHLQPDTLFSARAQRNSSGEVVPGGSFLEMIGFSRCPTCGSCTSRTPAVPLAAGI